MWATPASGWRRRRVSPPSTTSAATAYGRVFHDAPQVMHVGAPGEGVVLEPGMVFTIEPMVNAGRAETKILVDGWTAVTRDRSLSAQFEHTVGVNRRRRADLHAVAQGLAPAAVRGVSGGPRSGGSQAPARPPRRPGRRRPSHGASPGAFYECRANTAPKGGSRTTPSVDLAGRGAGCGNGAPGSVHRRLGRPVRQVEDAEQAVVSLDPLDREETGAGVAKMRLSPWTRAGCVLRQTRRGAGRLQDRLRVAVLPVEPPARGGRSGT